MKSLNFDDELAVTLYVGGNCWGVYWRGDVRLITIKKLVATELVVNQRQPKLSRVETPVIEFTPSARSQSFAT